MTSEKKTVVVGMSGGVDSSVAAALLVEQGYRVLGVMLRLWSEAGMERENRCCTPDDMAVARRVAAILDIPFYALDVRDRFRGVVVQAFLDGYQAGVTPNPCMFCNRSIRWGYMLHQAEAMGADFIATGHYARVATRPDGTVELLRGIDEQKDQSYIMSVLTQEQLKQTIFPLGNYHKPEVRDLARKFKLPVAEKADSQDLCFLGNEDYRRFLTRNAPEVVQPGVIVDRTGRTVGEHQGLAFYTIGQRKGLGLSSPEPLYVLEKDIERNRLVVGSAGDLGSTHLIAGPFNWISPKPETNSMPVEVKIRYKARLAQAILTPLPGENVRMEFQNPMRDITPGQLAVAYQGDCVIGSGVILTTGQAKDQAG
jgi:tRNA-specific 2-thiouridylase